MGKTVIVPGSCGELIQGYIKGSNQLISCPIDVYSLVNVKLTDTKKINIKKSKVKSHQALKLLLKYYDIEDLGLEIKFNSNLLTSKGMGSSTADISALLIAVMDLLNKEIDLDLIKKIAVKVEPSDSTFLEGLVLFDYLNGDYIEKLGKIKPIDLIVFDYGGKVETKEFNKNKDLKKLGKKNQKKIKNAYQLIKKGIKSNDIQLIGKAATMSSLANQNILEKPKLEELIAQLENKNGFLGLNTAHSGTIIGILIKDKKFSAEIIKSIKINFPNLELLFQTKIINGGYKILN
ncbi:MAG: kinase [Halanaerobiales bacterium]|nr:kinase [Halanaerobiales bacterium]